jgi:hypothetical protein
MSHIINTDPLTPIQQTAARYAAQANQQWLQLAQLFANLTKFIYSNPAGPQAAFDAFGTSASDLFTMGAAYAALVTAYTGVAPVSPIPVGATVVQNADGTVTYTYTAPATPATT